MIWLKYAPLAAAVALSLFLQFDRMRLQANLANCQKQRVELSAALDKQNQAILDLEARSKELSLAAEEARKTAQADRRKREGAATSILRRRPGRDECTDALNLLREYQQ